MIYLSIALVIISFVAYAAFKELLKFKTPKEAAVDISKDLLDELKADVERIKLALKIKTFSGGSK